MARQTSTYDLRHCDSQVRFCSHHVWSRSFVLDMSFLPSSDDSPHPCPVSVVSLPPSFLFSSSASSLFLHSVVLFYPAWHPISVACTRHTIALCLPLPDVVFHPSMQVPAAWPYSRPPYTLCCPHTSSPTFLYR